MSLPLNRQEFPDPHRDWRGSAEVDAAPNRKPAKQAALWRPLKTLLEPAVATLCRYANRLIDRTTGIPYSADELQTKILAAFAGSVATEDLVVEPGSGVAAAGELGETRQALRYLGDSALALTTEVGANIASISLTPGDWDVEGVVSFLSASATPGFCYASISTVSGNLVFNGQEGYAAVTGSNYGSAPVTRRIIQIAETTTIYLVANAVFDSGAMEAGGAITARRVR